MRASHPFSHFKIVLSRIPQLLSSRQKVHHLSPLSVSGSLILQGAVAFGESGFVVSTMAKIFKYISNIFVVKEREMEIGLPTDVKHVAHIGWDGPSDSAPSWMNEFKNEPDFSTLGRNNNSNRRDSTSSMAASSIWASQEFETSMGRQPSTNSIDHLPNDSTNAPKKTKRKKVKSSSSSSSSSRSWRQMKTSKAAYTNMEPTPNLLV